MKIKQEILRINTESEVLEAHSEDETFQYSSQGQVQHFCPLGHFRAAFTES